MLPGCQFLEQFGSSLLVLGDSSAEKHDSALEYVVEGAVLIGIEDDGAEILLDHSDVLRDDFEVGLALLLVD